MLRWLRAGIEANLDRHQILYPWWVPLASHLGQVAAVLISLALREAIWPLDPLLICLPLVMVSPLVQFRTNRWLPWWADSAGSVLAALLLLSRPQEGVLDLAPALLALATAEITARDGVREGLAVAAVGQLVLIKAAIRPGLPGAPLYTFELLLGFVIGAMLLWQMRALIAERQAREQAWDRATTAERERIAREIHDLVAHSLSVSLLQITGARHALRDVREATGPEDTAEAVAEVDAALADAEQVGRRAMGDIRRAVGAMADGTSERHALPGGGDIAALVRELADAGLAVEYDEQGDPAALPAAAGLGLYRIAQESLANVVKHAGADAQVRVRFSATGARARLRITNPLPAGRPRPDGLGSGLAGMQARAAQLGARLDAGPLGGDWVVDVRLGGPARSGLELPCGHTLWKAETA
ncbi:sensor histidine kinase [Nocardioides sp. L-11A]|uniref:sensor histidine kinase n=1 Tax=Nocardioides sp. L-11A TaxID=3043848 RepID=UPI00249C2D55|nr:histidine kinase [Nocardioides sp. L-11A]